MNGRTVFELALIAALILTNLGALRRFIEWTLSLARGGAK